MHIDNIVQNIKEIKKSFFCRQTTVELSNLNGNRKQSKFQFENWCKIASEFEKRLNHIGMKLAECRDTLTDIYSLSISSNVVASLFTAFDVPMSECRCMRCAYVWIEYKLALRQQTNQRKFC